MTTFSQRLPQESFEAIQRGLRSAVEAEGLGAVLTDDPDDVAYLTGFFHHPGERPVAVWLPVDGPVLLLVPLLESGHARSQDPVAEIVEYPEYPGTVNPFAGVSGRVRARRVGHPLTSTVARRAGMAHAFPDSQLVATDVVMRARYIKRPEEVALHREAARITGLMLEAGVARVRETLESGDPMPSEVELASFVARVGTSIMYEQHSDVVVVGMLAGGLVYGGENSAFPHGLPSQHRLSVGETFMLSLGCAVGGRFVECERTFVIGEPMPEQRRYYEAVRQAQATGGQSIGPGTPCNQSNRTCLDVLRKARLGEYILHRQGHGIGLGMHEPPWYRISDSVLVTADGSENLTSYPRSLESCVLPV